MSAELSDVDRQVLRFIRTELKERGYPPTVREIGQHMGSSSTTHLHVNNLVAAGVLLREPSKPRAIRVAKGVRA